MTDTAPETKRKRGRPPKKPAVFGEPELQLPKPPNPKPTPELLFEYWKELETIAPNRVMGYLYRLAPRIKRSPAYIDKSGCMVDAERYFDAEYITERWGEGQYQIRLVDPYAPRGTASELAQSILRISNPMRPPVIDDLAELDLTWPDNREFVGKLRSQGIHLPGDLQPAGTDPKLAEKLDQIAGSLQKPDKKQIGETTMERLLERALDPEAQLQHMERLVSLTRPRDDGQSANTFMPLFVQMMQQNQEREARMMAALTQRNPTPPPAAPPAPPPSEDPITQQIKQRLADKILEELDAPPAPAADTAWERMLPMVLPAVTSFLGAAGAWLMSRAQPAPAQPGPAAPQPPPAALTPAQPQPHSQPQEQQMQAQLVAAIRGPLMETLQYGHDGRRLRQLIERQYGTATMSTIAALPQRDSLILAALEADAQFGTMVKADRARFTRLIAEVFSPPPQADDDDTDEQ